MIVIINNIIINNIVIIILSSSLLSYFLALVMCYILTCQMNVFPHCFSHKGTLEERIVYSK